LEKENARLFFITNTQFAAQVVAAKDVQNMCFYKDNQGSYVL
jgi:hypothetical protein